MRKEIIARPEPAAPRIEPTPRSAAPDVSVDGIGPKRRAWVDWVGTADHKRLGFLFVGAALGFFVLGGTEALLMRVQLGAPNNTFLSPADYNELFTLHGMTMLFLFALPVLVGLGTYIVPLMIGARQLAFPRLQALSFWLLIGAGVVLYGSLLYRPPGSGFTSLPTLTSDGAFPSAGVDAYMSGVFLVGLSLLLAGINFAVTIHNMRAPGMTYGRLPLFAWSVLIFAYAVILVTPVLLAADTMLLTDRHYRTNFFNPAQGGDPLLWQYLFWFFGHAAIYVLVLPALGILSEVISVFSRKRVLGYTAMAMALALVALFGVMSYGAEMFGGPVTTGGRVFFMLAMLAIGIPLTVKFFNWIGTLWRGTIEFRAPMVFALGSVAMLVVGALSGVFLAIFPLGWQVSDSYFYVAHLHYVLLGGAGFAILAGVYYWFPKMTGRIANERFAKLSFWLMLIGFNVTFLPQFSLGLSGMPNRIYEYQDYASLGWQAHNLISTIGAFVLALGALVTLGNLLAAWLTGVRAGADPWRGNTLEWFVTSPPPENNFDVVPTVRSLMVMDDIRGRVKRAEQQEGGT